MPLHPILKRIYTVVEEKKNIEEDEELKCYPKEQILHYLQKYKFLKENEFIGEKVKTEFGEITETMVRREVENLTVLTFEVQNVVIFVAAIVLLVIYIMDTMSGKVRI